MHFVYFDLIFLAIFIIFVAIFLYKNRKKIDREGIIFLYRTKFGLKAIEKASKHKRFLNFLEYFSIFFGYIFMFLAILLLFFVLYTTIKAAFLPKVPPIAPLIPYFPSIFKIPGFPPFYFIYWLVIILLIAITHEFSHGIFAKKEGIKIKSTGFGFLGPFIAAFVEPDERMMEKKKIKNQIAILSAGSFANFILALVFVLILHIFFVVSYSPIGFSGYFYAIEKININEIKNITIEKISISKDKSMNNVNETYGNYTHNQVFYSINEFQNFLNEIQNKTNTNLSNISFEAKISTENFTYFIDNDLWLLQQALAKKEVSELIVYLDSPAYKKKLSGTIISIDGKKIRKQKDIMEIINGKKPNDTIVIETLDRETKKKEVYEISLSANPKNSSKAFLGLSYFAPGISNIFSFLYPYFNINLAIEPRYNENVANFFKDFIYWVILIAISVALFNMLPISILDGGKVSYFTFLMIFKNKNKALKAYSMFTLLIISLLILIFIVWFFRI